MVLSLEKLSMSYRISQTTKQFVVMPMDYYRQKYLHSLGSASIHADTANLSRCAQKRKKNGIFFIYHPFIQGSGVELLCSFLNANGFVLDGDYPTKDSICMLGIRRRGIVKYNLMTYNIHSPAILQ
jgi:hypothetical protein